ncbi:unnamed protein product, partial [Hymenolepis diminuta]
GNFNFRTESSPANLVTFPNVITNAVELTILGELGSYHTIYLENRDVCLSPDLISKPETPEVLTTNMSLFDVKVVTLGSGNAIVLQGGQKGICIPQGLVAVNQLYDVVVYVSNGKYIHRGRHTILIANKSTINTGIEVMRPLSSVGNALISSVEEVILGSSCEGYICSLRTMSQWGITMVYPDFSNWILSQAEMENYTEGWNSSTLIISSHLLLRIPRETQLIVCMTIRDRPASESKLCKAFYVTKPRECDSCFSEAPDLIDEFQNVCIVCNCFLKPDDSFELYVKSQSGLQTVSVSKQSSVCSLIPYSDGFVTPCIKSLPGSDVYIDMCFRQIRFKSKSAFEIERQFDDILTGKNSILD